MVISTDHNISSQLLQTPYWEDWIQVVLNSDKKEFTFDTHRMFDGKTVRRETLCTRCGLQFHDISDEPVQDLH